jgi:SAM-dependent methyltransferase
MAAIEQLRAYVKAARRRGAGWITLFDVVRLLPTAEGRARVWTRTVHRNSVHQTTPYTEEERYPELFDLAAQLKPDAGRILSFGCATGEEIVSLRRRFPAAEIVGAEINPRSRRIAGRRLASDPLATVVASDRIAGEFDLIFALAVLQREPHKVEELEVADLTTIYPFDRFDSAIDELVSHLRPGGLLCVMYAQYRVEDSSSAGLLEPLPSPAMPGLLFGRDGRRLEGAFAASIFRKR